MDLMMFLFMTVNRHNARVNVDSSGNEANNNDLFYPPSLYQRDGRYVAFESRASNLVPGDTNQQFDTFVHDRTTGKTTRVSVNSAGWR